MQYRQHRYPTDYPVDVRTPTGSRTGMVTDVNATGAQLVGIPHLRRGDKLSLGLLSHQVNAVVCWAHGDKAGIVFRPQISLDQLDTIRQRRDGRPGWRRGSVGFGFAEMR